jgi:1-deoxy-D-xylulose-5-phosphate reductoisomerase
MAWAVLRGPEGSSAVLNAANEVAVASFLQQRIGFDAIHALNVQAVESIHPGLDSGASIDDLLALDERARSFARSWVKERSR